MIRFYINLFAKHFKRLNAFEVILLLFLFWATVWPLVYPNWRTDGYQQISDNEIESDIFNCINKSEGHLPVCPLFAADLDSYFNVFTQIDKQLIESIATKYDIRSGGRHWPKGCRSVQKVAIIVPFRDRWTHLSLFVQHMHPFLSKQLIDYTIFIVEQNDTKPFNRGKLFNAGAIEVNKLDTFCCYIFHDIDVLPSNQNQLYYCSQEPRHMCSALDKFRYVLIYPNLLGGVVAITKSQFNLVNGYSNLFEGWGGEDDDFYNRIKAKSLTLRRWSAQVSKCIMLSHKSEKPNPNRLDLLKEGNTRFDSEGLNSLGNGYQVIAINLEPLFTQIKLKFI